MSCVPPTSITGTVSSAAASAASTFSGLITAASQGNLVSTIEADAAKAAYNANVIAEYIAICGSLFGIFPSGFILEIQAILRFLRIQPSPTSTAIEIFLIPLIFLAIITFVLGLIWNYSRKNWQIALAVFIILCAVYYFMVIKPSEGFADAPVKTTVEPFQNFGPAPTGPQYTLLNIQPAAVKQIAYVGPKEQGGSFNSTDGVLNALNAGVRFMILQIDYLDSKKGSNFDDVGVPTLLYRSNSGNVISSNGESIGNVASKLSTYAFNSQVPMNTQPVVLYLHFVRTPNYLKSPKKYMSFLSAVASALAPISSKIMKSSGGTTFTRQQNEATLLSTPLNTFENQILILSNVDTSLFRNASQLGLPVAASSEDLDSMVHLRVYLENEFDHVGATAVGTNPNAVILSYDRLRSMTPAEKTTFAEKGKTRFTIAMPKPMEPTRPNENNSLFDTTGVNVIPVNLLGKTYQDFAKILSSWGTTPFYKMKPVLLQSIHTNTTGYNENFMSSP
jgi:hypothetical protein